MITCAHCRSQLPDEAKFCNECGTPIARPEAPQGRTKIPSKTVVGLTSPFAEPALAPEVRPNAAPQVPFAPPVTGQSGPTAPPPKNRMANTVLGLQSPIAQEQAPQQAPARKKLQQTVVGLTSPVHEAAANATAPTGIGPQTQPGTPIQPVFGTSVSSEQGKPGQSAGQEVMSVRAKALKNTVMIPSDSVITAPATALTGQSVPGKPAPSQVNLTAVGAMSPVHKSEPPSFKPPEVAPKHGSMAPGASLRQSEKSHKNKPSKAFAFVILGVAVLLGVVVAVVMLRPKKPSFALEAQLIADQKAPQLKIRCAQCVDGTALSLNSHRVELKQGQGTFSLSPDELKAGKQLFPIVVQSPGVKESTTIQVETYTMVLPKPSLAPLGQGISAVDLQLDLASDVTGVEIEGEKVAIEQGKATRRIPIERAKENAQDKIERSIAYTLTIGEKTEKGSVQFVIPFAPLRMSTPLRYVWLVGDKPIQIAGRTSPEMTIRLESKQELNTQALATIQSNKEGLFQNEVSPHKDAHQLEITAFSAKHAPTRLRLPVYRATSMSDAFTQLRKQNKASEDWATKGDALLGESFVGTVQIVQSSIVDGRSVAVGDWLCHVSDAKVCATVRVLLPSQGTVKGGDHVDIGGYFHRIFKDSQQKTVIEIDAVVMQASKPR